MFLVNSRGACLPSSFLTVWWAGQEEGLLAGKREREENTYFYRIVFRRGFVGTPYGGEILCLWVNVFSCGYNAL